MLTQAAQRIHPSRGNCLHMFHQSDWFGKPPFWRPQYTSTPPWLCFHERLASDNRKSRENCNTLSVWYRNIKIFQLRRLLLNSNTEPHKRRGHLAHNVAHYVNKAFPQINTYTELSNFNDKGSELRQFWVCVCTCKSPVKTKAPDET